MSYDQRQGFLIIIQRTFKKMIKISSNHYIMDCFYQ